ncbi:hypothetical protein GGX14DRAFT_368089 [Mycena pura]|uniref:Uncharacterized protein n=1 Tax=Mycena pura TaxID=153505 RepID=A0AAD6VBT8_9AGAR|nr:hypothetical protein GGX14DRAFT_368089 [Mycena pura]
MADPVIDLSPDGVFLPKDWIGRQKKWDDAPGFVREACSACTEPPSFILDTFPDINLPVSDFLNLSLPVQSNALNLHALSTWFTKNPPTQNTSIQHVALIRDRTIPPRVTLLALECALGQFWLDGCQGITDPRYGGTVVLPLWILTVWRHWSNTVMIKRDWAKAMAWIERVRLNSHVVKTFPHLAGIFQTRAWCSTIRAGGQEYYSHDFAQLLSSQMVSEDMAEVLVSKVQQRLKEDPTKQEAHFICASRFNQVLALYEERKGKRLPTSLQEVEDWVKSHPKGIVWFVALLNNHEFAFKVDFMAKTVAYGDGIRGYPEPKSTIRHIMYWLQRRFEGSFKTLGKTLAHGVQKDSISCIPIAVNAVTHAIFQDTLWTPVNREVHRIQLFLNVVPEYSTVRAAATVIMDLLEGTLSAAGICAEDVDPSADGNGTGGLDLDAPAVQVPVDNSSAEDVLTKDASAAEPPKQKSLFAFFSSKRARSCSPPPSKPSTSSVAARPAKKKLKTTSGAQSAPPLEYSSKKSASSEKKDREDLDRGIFDEKRLNKWRADCRISDPSVQFDQNKLRSARCSHCGLWKLSKKPYRATSFQEHIQKCQDPKVKTTTAARDNRTITDYFADARDSIARKFCRQRPLERLTCPGLREQHDPKIKAYLRRTSTSGSGTRSVTTIAETVFGTFYRLLSPSQKDQVDDLQRAEHTWRNDHQSQQVRALDCTGIAGGADRNKVAKPCAACNTVLRSERFKAVLRKPLPDDDNYKHVNARFRNDLVGEQYLRAKGLQQLIEADSSQSVFVRFAVGVLGGKYDDYNVLLGLVDAMVKRVEREEKGKGMQNFQYTPAWDEFMHIVRIHSPRAHQFISNHFQVRSARNIRIKESRVPKLPLTIEDKTFSLLDAHLKAIDYTGPIALSCDDTKLQASLRLYWDGDEQSYYVVGAVGGPIRVMDPSMVGPILDDPNNVRLWMVQVPLPKMSPSVLAAIPITDKMSVPALRELHNKIINGLLELEIPVASYSCDGTETERGLQHQFAADAPNHHTLSVPEVLGGAERTIHIPIVGGRPIVMVQDSKHALKTYRNNLFSGARLLTLGSYVALYHHIRDLAFDDDSPLYHRDVEKVDRQDDRAATRTFSAATLLALIRRLERCPELRGVIVYLFVFGEAVDAWQNRHITHNERILMVLRARYFLDMWLAFLQQCPAYDRTKYCISREAIDITHYLVDGLLSLIVTDFTMLDFYQMVPKLGVRIREDNLQFKNGHESDVRARAAGYHHTWADTKDVTLPNLLVQTTNAQIRAIADAAREEARGLFTLIDVDASLLAASTIPAPFPSIREWAPEDDNGHEDAWAEPELSEMDELSRLVLETSTNHFISNTKPETDRRLETLSNATLALTIDDQIKMYTSLRSCSAQLANFFSLALPDPSEDDIEDQLAHERTELANLRAGLRIADIEENVVLNCPFSPSRTEDINFNALARVREDHQTRHAARSVRTHSHTNASKDDSEPSIPTQILREFHKAIRQSQDRGTSTGQTRKNRWESRDADGPAVPARGTSEVQTTNGNSGNAQLAATQTVNAAQAKRRTVFTQAKLPTNILVEPFARVTSKRPIQLGSYGFVYGTEKIMLARVVALYSRTGGKNGKHAAVTKSSTIAAVSYIGVQLFEPLAAQRTFSKITYGTAPHQVFSFKFLPSIAFLSLLDHEPARGTGAMADLNVVVDTPAWAWYNALNGAHTGFSTAMKLFGKRGGLDSNERDF